MEAVLSEAQGLLGDVDGNSALAALVVVHFCGLALALPGVAMGDLLGLRMLLLSGETVSRRSVGVAHSLVFSGLCLLLMSGTALIVIKVDPMALPPALVVKLCLVMMLCANALALQQYLLPLARFGIRPLAATLPLGHLVRAIAIGTISLTAWLGITAVSFSSALDSFSFTALATGVAVTWSGLFVLAMGAAFVTRWARKSRGRNASQADESQNAHSRGAEGWYRIRDSDVHDDLEDEPEFEPRPEPPAQIHDPHVIRAGDVISLGERLAKLTGMPPVNDNPREPVGERLQFGDFSPRRDHAHQPPPPPPQKPGRHFPPADGAARLRSFDTTADRDAAPPPVPGGERDGTAEETYAWRDVKWACRRAVRAVFAISFVTNMLVLTGPLFMLQVYDRVLTSKSLPTLTALFGLAVVLFAFMGLLEALRNRLLVRVGLRIDRLLSRQIFAAAIVPQDSEARAQSSQLMRDVRHIRQFVGGAGAAALFDMPWAPLYFALLFLFHPLLGGVAVAGALGLVVLALLNEWFSRGPVGDAARYGAEGERLAESGRRNDEILRAMGMGESLRERWLDVHAREALSQVRGSDVSVGFSTTIKTLRLILQSAILATGAYLVLQGGVSAGIMIASSIMLSRALAPIETAVGGWRGFIAAREGAGRLARAFAEAPTTPSRLRLSKPQGRLVVEGVYAGPPGKSDPILKGLSFSLEPGDALGVLGSSGAGKSALARVLVGVWTPIRGDVRLDGAALSHWPPEQLGANVGYVPQAAELLEGTVAENIARFERDAAPEEIIAAARMANVHDMIQTLADGYNTRVGAGGAVLSGGQRQRIALARALYRQPALLVFDEPTANLDATGERALNAAVEAARKAGSAVVVLTNRRKALENVNLLLVLKDGRQAAFGEKDEVLTASMPAGAGRAAAGASEPAGASAIDRQPEPQMQHRFERPTERQAGRVADVAP